MIQNIKHKHALILWNVAPGTNKISDLIVIEHKREELPIRPDLDKRYSHSAGNCYTEWPKSTFADFVFVGLFIQYGFINDKAFKDAMKEIIKIDKFREELCPHYIGTRIFIQNIYDMNDDDFENWYDENKKLL